MVSNNTDGCVLACMYNGLKCYLKEHSVFKYASEFSQHISLISKNFNTNLFHNYLAKMKKASLETISTHLNCSSIMHILLH